MAPVDWALVVSTGIGGAFGLLCLFDGTRRIVLYGPNPASGLPHRGRRGDLPGARRLRLLEVHGGQGEAHFVEFVMWLVWGAAALVFGALFAREPAPEPEPAEEDHEDRAGAGAARRRGEACRSPLPQSRQMHHRLRRRRSLQRVGTVPLPKPGIPPAAARAPQPAAAPPHAAPPKRGSVRTPSRCGSLQQWVGIPYRCRSLEWVTIPSRCRSRAFRPSRRRRQRPRSAKTRSPCRNRRREPSRRRRRPRRGTPACRRTSP